MQFRYQISLPRPIWSSFCSKLSRIDPDVRQRIDQFFYATSQDICVRRSNGEMTVCVHSGIDEARLLALLSDSPPSAYPSHVSPSADHQFSSQAPFSFKTEQA